VNRRNKTTDHPTNLSTDPALSSSGAAKRT